MTKHETEAVRIAVDLLGREEVIGALQNTLACADAPLEALFRVRIAALRVLRLDNDRQRLIEALRPFAKANRTITNIKHTDFIDAESLLCELGELQ